MNPLLIPISLAGLALCGAVARGPECVSAAVAAGGEAALAVAMSPVRDAPVAKAEASAVEAKAWLGVRVTPIPEPLAAHLDRSGLMVANVVVDSPADRAGLERYDVLVSLNGRDVTDLETLAAALNDVGAGNDGTLKIIRGGREQSLGVRPVARPDGEEPEFKYEEPAPESSDTFERYFGHRLFRDSHGNWMFEPLGRLRDLPDDVQKHLDDIGGPAWEKWIDKWKSMQLDPFRMHLYADPDDKDFRWFFKFDDSDDAQKQVDIRIECKSDDQTLVVDRAVDGRVTVQRTDSAGNTTSTTYESVEELAEKDPEAHKLLRRHALTPGHSMYMMTPSFDDLPKLQLEFQTKIRDLLEKSKDLERRAIEQSQRAVDRVRQHVRSHTATSAGGGHSESTSITIDDGRIKIVITKDGDTKTYEFDNEQQLRESEPELYERFKELLQNGDGERTDAEEWFACLA